MRHCVLALLSLSLLTAGSRANAQRAATDACWTSNWARQAIHHDQYDRVELSPDDVQTIVLATRELLAICARGSSASDVQASHRDSLADLINSAIVHRSENHPGGGGLAMVNVFSADGAKMTMLAGAICKSEYVNIEPFIVTAAGGAQQVPDEGYVLIQRTEGGDAAFVWRELWNGGAAIPDPGKEYTVTVLGFLDGELFRARQAVNAGALIPVPGRPGCRIIAPQLTPIKRR